jgi:formate hydrogenlyase subunit 6/NADH:ubiquinone oxidoreductase subunit I
MKSAWWRFSVGTMLRDVLRSLFKQPATEHYPFEKRPAPEHLRGALQFDPSKCSGCGVCVKDCPARAIELITLDKASKRFVLRYHVDRCTYCAQCVQSCRFKCLAMSDEQWELASLKKEPFTVYYGNHDDVNAVLAKFVKPNTLPPEKK